jgi:tetratricopeptide (TPR) repeat protein
MCQRDPTLAAIVIAALVLGTTMAVARQRVDDRLAGADAALQAGRYADAAGEYEAWLQAHPDSEQVLYALGVCYIQLGRPAYAADALRRYVRLVPASSRGHALLGLSLLDGAATAAARTALEKALALDPREPLAVETRARVALLDGEPATAVRLLKPLMDASSMLSRDTTTARAAPVLDDDNLRALFAEALIRSGDAPAAAAMLDGYLAADVHRPVPIHVLAAWAHIRSGELRKAADVCEQGIRLHPDSEIEGVYLTLPAPLLAERTAARLRQLQEHLDVSEAIALGRVLTDVDPRRKTRARELAEKVLGEAIALAPRNASAHYNYGRAVRETSVARALAAWDRALALEPPAELALQIHTQIAKARHDGADLDGADQAFKAALAINRTLRRRVPEASLEYVRFLRLTSRSAQAEEVLKETAAWNPWAPEVHVERARLLADEGRWTEVVEAGEFVLRNAGAAGDLERVAHHLLARAYTRLNDPEKAQVHRTWIEAHAQ